ncbi:hypothetical protein CXB51_008398 [Gossypium anomalum]|uniref:DUF7745 domain-containing protein n=1 Tax=Gossypium anomalum TaxID=47600 RepID=A0A8J5ZAP5_9ROSI|nr:hypothetical protein CXB51_008398 [Gossypium anomalum]
MTVVVTPLSGSEKLHLREVFASAQDSGSLSGYICTYGFVRFSSPCIDSRSVSKLGSFVMENGLLDRVEGNANVHRWSEQTQLEKGDSIAVEYMSELSDYTRISVTQNNLQELKEIWNQWGNETKQLFYGNYGDLPYLLDIQVDEHLFRALAQFWNPAYSCFTFGEVDLVPTVEEYTALLRCPRFQIDRIYSRAASIPTFWKKLMTITWMSEQWITTRIKEKGECKCISWDALKGLILTHPDETKKVNVFALSLYRLMVFPRALGYMDEATTDLFYRLGKRVTSVPAILAETFRSLGTVGRLVQAGLLSKDVEWRAPWMIPGEILYRCGSFDWVPLLRIWGAIGYAPLLVLRQFGLRQFVPVTHGLAQSEFVYRGADYKKKLKGIAINPAMTPEYIEWRGKRVNDNIPKPNVEGARPVEEYLRVMPSELEIMRQEFERKNLELEKKITKLEEEKMYLSLDVDVQKKENLALEEENKGLKSKVTELGRSLRWHRSHDSTVELKELKSKVDNLEVALHDGKLRIERLEA